MVAIGYALCSEEHPPNELIRYIRLAEEAGFAFGFIADHYHPWVGQQDQSPFIWSLLGGIAQATRRLPLVISVTCPTMGLHPAIIAQAAATIAAMMPGRCCLGLETGEALSIRVCGPHWHLPQRQLEMLEETVQVIRQLWRGGVQSHWGRHYTIENARIFRPLGPLPSILIAAGGGRSAALAARIGDGLMASVPEQHLLQAFERAGGNGKPRYGSMTVCWVPDEPKARSVALSWWKTAMLGTSTADLPLPAPFVHTVVPASEAKAVHGLLYSRTSDHHVEMIREYAATGFDYIHVHHIGPNQEEFIRFYQREVLPHFRSAPDIVSPLSQNNRLL